MCTQRSVVKWFDAKKGYGFLVNPHGGQDIFVHYAQIETEQRFRTLRTGEVVEYQLTDGPKGPHAVQVFCSTAIPDPSADVLEDEFLESGLKYSSQRSKLILRESHPALKIGMCL